MQYCIGPLPQQSLMTSGELLDTRVYSTFALVCCDKCLKEQGCASAGDLVKAVASPLIGAAGT